MAKKTKNIGVIVNIRRPRALRALQELRKEAARYGFALFSEEAETAETIDAKQIPADEFGQNVDLVLAFGGDGTVLRAARILQGSDVAVMGINLGSLGFLTSVGDSEISATLELIAQQACQISERETAQCRILQNGNLIGEGRALNDLVIGWGASSRIVTLNLVIDGEQVSSFMCDGMIVSTPTGSTGHALSSGGPILLPDIGVFGINVICPHTLSSRPLVIPNSSLIEIEVVDAAKELILSVDGQDECRVEQGSRIEICRSPYTVKFLQLLNHSYFSVLARKLHWHGSSLQL